MARMDELVPMNSIRVMVKPSLLKSTKVALSYKVPTVALLLVTVLASENVNRIPGVTVLTTGGSIHSVGCH